MNASDVMLRAEFLDNAATAISDYLHAESARLKRKLNSNAPIHKLPSELFEGILLDDLHLFFSLNPGERTRRSRRKEFASVCHSWLQAVKKNPLFWTDISWASKDWEIALERSQDAPLRIQCIPAECNMWFKSPTVPDFLQKVAAHSNRWQSVHLSLLESDADAVGKAFEGKTSGLLDLTVGRQMISTQTPHIHLQLNGEGSLRHISLSRAIVPWDSQRLSRLQSLEIAFLHAYLPTLEDLHRILSASPQLERLGFHLLEGRLLHPSVSPLPIDMPSLVSLHVEHVPRELPQYILKTLRAPHLKSLFFETREDYLEIEEYRTYLLRLAAQILRSQPRITLNNEVSVRSVMIEGERIYHRGSWLYSKGTDQCYIRYPTNDPLHSVWEAADFIRKSNTAAEITLLANGRYTTDAVISSDVPLCPIEVLDTLPNIRSISAAAKPDVTAILRCLGEAKVGPDGITCNPCPNLAALKLEETIGIDAAAVKAVQAKRVNRIAEVVLPRGFMTSDDEDD